MRLTVEVLFHLLESLAARGVTRLDQVLDLQHHARDGRRFECPLPRDAVAALPTAPGIYHFYDADGRLLYIGKAKNLRERVGSYLSNAAGHSNKTLDLIRHSHDVRVRRRPGPSSKRRSRKPRRSARHQPPYNRLGKHLPRIAFLKLTVTDIYPRLSIARKLGAGRARYVGPFRGREEAERVLGLLTRLFRLTHLRRSLASRRNGRAVLSRASWRLLRAVCGARIDKTTIAGRWMIVWRCYQVTSAPPRTS